MWACGEAWARGCYLEPSHKPGTMEGSTDTVSRTLGWTAHLPHWGEGADSQALPTPPAL